MQMPRYTFIVLSRLDVYVLGSTLKLIWQPIWFHRNKTKSEKWEAKKRAMMEEEEAAMEDEMADEVGSKSMAEHDETQPEESEIKGRGSPSMTTFCLAFAEIIEYFLTKHDWKVVVAIHYWLFLLIRLSFMM